MVELPLGFKNKYCELLGEEEAERLFSAIDQDSKKAFRINPLKPNVITYSTENSVPDIKNGYYGEISGQDPEWVSGLVYSQDPSAMFPAHVAHVQPGEKVLDLCAAPGGKSTGLGEELKNDGLLVANEISSSRAKILRENIERWGIPNALVTNTSSDQLAKYFPKFFDKILVDAPCSGEGMFRKNPDAITYWSQEYVETCVERQKEILTEAVKMLKPGGQLIYSTCTFSPEEDEQIVQWLVDKFEMSILPIVNVESDKVDHGHPEWANGNSELAKTLRFWPQDGIGEGQFVALLAAPGERADVKPKKKSKKGKKKARTSKLSKDEKTQVAKVLDKFELPEFLQNWSNTALVRNDHVFVPATADRDLNGLKILNNGVELGVLKKNRFEPGHQLAEVLGQVRQTEVINLATQDEYTSYLHGETLQVDSNLKGFVLVSYHEMIFSFGKIAGKTLKNFYPKGLRILKK